MHRSLPANRRRVRIVLAVFAASVVAALAPAAASGGLYFVGYLSSGSPYDCSASWGGGCAQSGFNYWYANTITKYSGDRVAIGFRDVNGGYSNYWTYGAGANGGTYTATKYDLGAPGYNRAFCAWYSGAASDVDCTVSL